MNLQQKVIADLNNSFLDVLRDPLNKENPDKGECILRYVVELKTRPAFTATKKDLSKPGADKEVERLCKLNKKAGYEKYSGFILYSRNNIEIQRYSKV